MCPRAASRAPLSWDVGTRHYCPRWTLGTASLFTAGAHAGAAQVLGGEICSTFDDPDKITLGAFRAARCCLERD
jgi:hypothetical protein